MKYKSLLSNGQSIMCRNVNAIDLLYQKVNIDDLFDTASDIIRHSFVLVNKSIEISNLKSVSINDPNTPA